MVGAQFHISGSFDYWFGQIELGVESSLAFPFSVWFPSRCLLADRLIMWYLGCRYMYLPLPQQILCFRFNYIRPKLASDATQDYSPLSLSMPWFPYFVIKRYFRYCLLRVAFLFISLCYLPHCFAFSIADTAELLASRVDFTVFQRAILIFLSFVISFSYSYLNIHTNTSLDFDYFIMRAYIG